MIRYLFIVFILLLSCSEQDFKKQNNLNTDLIEKYLGFSVKSNFPSVIRETYADSAYALVKELDNDSLKRLNYFKTANRYFYIYKLDKYKTVTDEVLSLSLKADDTLSVARANSYLGDYFFEKARNDSAYYYFNTAEKLYFLKGDIENASKNKLRKANILLYEKDFLGSETSAVKVLSFALTTNNYVLAYESYVNLGSSLSGLGDYNTALDYHLNALQTIEFFDDPYYKMACRSQTYNNIGLVYQNMGEHKKAIENFNNGLKTPQLLQLQPILYASLLDNYAYSFFKQGNVNRLREFNIALKIRDSLDNVAGKINSRLHLAEYFLYNKDTAKALKYNNQANQLAKKSKYNKEVLLTLDLYTKILPEKGLQYAKEYITLNNALQEQERATRNKLARIEFETEEIILENEKISNQKYTIIVISIVGFLFGVLIYSVQYLRTRQKQLVFEQEQQKVNESIYKLMLEQENKLEEVRSSEKNRIAKELHDGVMNKLASTRLNLYVLNKKTDEETIQKAIKYIDEIQNIEKEVRAIAHDLKNDFFTNKSSFTAILEELIGEQNAISESNITLSIDKDILWENIDSSIKIHIYRIIQEALSNCNKYANANTIEVIISFKNEGLKIVIKDDGIGFSVKRRNKGIGIKNMIDRATEMKGFLVIESKPGKGTKIIINSKLNKHENKNIANFNY